MRRLAFTLAIVSVVPSAVPALAAPADPGRAPARAPLADTDANHIADGLDADIARAAPGDTFRVVATFTSRAAAAAGRRSVPGIAVQRTYHIVDGFIATMTAPQVRALSRAPGVIRLEGPSTYAVQMEAARADYGTDRAAADFGVSGAGVGICVLDTGAHAAHEQLDGAKIAGWMDFINGQADPYDDNGHGTHVASIAAGEGTGGALAPRFRGVASGAPLYIGKVLPGSGTTTNIQPFLDGVQWCAENPAVRVISLSLASSSPSDGLDAVSQAVNTAVTDYGKVAVVAANNSGDMPGSVGSPSAAVQAITVGNVAEHGALPEKGWHSDGVYLVPSSGRGPTLAGVVKPDVAAPGHSILAAMDDSPATYVAYTGTSMATPFVAGTVALALERNPGLDPAGVRALVEGTAQDRGPTGKDNDWGAGLLDGYAVVDQAGTSPTGGTTAFPTASYVEDSVANNGTFDHAFTIDADDLDVPIAATITLGGEAVCVFFWPPDCLGYEWTPDLDAWLIDPNFVTIADSICANDDECGVGRQETLHAMPTVAGTYRVRIQPFADYPNNGQGGSFSIDLSHGPLAGAPAPPPNNVPVASPDVYGTVEGVALNVGAPGVLGNDSDADGDPLTAALATGASSGTVALNADGSFTYTPSAGFTGTDAFTYTAGDGSDASAPTTVSITVEPALHVGDLDGTSAKTKRGWDATVTVLVHTSAHGAVPNVLVEGTWTGGIGASCTTGSNGKCSVKRTNLSLRKTASITFTVTRIDGRVPAPGSHDPDGDSTGTSITVARPA